MVTVLYWLSITETRPFKSDSRSPSQWPTYSWYIPVLQCFICGGDSRSDVESWCCLFLCFDAGKIYIHLQNVHFSLNLNLNIAQNTNQFRDNNIWKQMCMKTLSYINALLKFLTNFSGALQPFSHYKSNISHILGL